jgi:hypothetical protein
MHVSQPSFHYAIASSAGTVEAEVPKDMLEGGTDPKAASA